MAAANRPSSFSLLSVYFLLFLNNLFHLSIEANDGGFSTSIIHRDSPRSPFYNSSESHSERHNKALLRSNARAEYLMKSVISKTRNSNVNSSRNSTTIQSYDRYADGQYIMQMSIGTPPFDILAIMDTGSDLMWTGCEPCDGCFIYNINDPVKFNPENSTTYKQLPCKYSSELCPSCEAENKCGYTYEYADESFTQGYLSQETFTFKSNSISEGGRMKFQNITFGCAHNINGVFGLQATGLVGLGGGPLSIIRQMEGTIGGKFSTCFVPRSSNSSSMVKFGGSNDALFSSNRTVSTPLIRQPDDTFYLVNLQGFVFGNKRIPYNIQRSKKQQKISSSKDGALIGNMIIDSGTYLTYVPREFYEKLILEVSENTIGGTKVPFPGGYYGLCYKADDPPQFPKIYAHFAGGAYIVLPPDGTFIPVQTDDGDLLCLGMVSVDVDAGETIGILGDLLQTNYLIEYDLGNSKVSFLRYDCRHYK